MTHPNNSIEELHGVHQASAPILSTASQKPIDSSALRCDDCHLPPQALIDRNHPRFDLSRPVHGWPELARTITDNPGFEAFPAFRDLNIKSLLYYQCELTSLRSQLHALEWDDHLHGKFEDASKYSRRVDLLLSSESSQNAAAHQQIDLVNKIREVLDKYSES
jgi:hypothetical protein